MISLITIGPARGGAFGAPAPARKSLLRAGGSPGSTSEPKLSALMGARWTAPSLVTYRPNDTPGSLAPYRASAWYSGGASPDESCTSPPKRLSVRRRASFVCELN